MKLRMFTMVRAFWQWDSRDRDYDVRRLTSTPKLQHFDEALQQWVDVPSVTETDGPGEKPE